MTIQNMQVFAAQKKTKGVQECQTFTTSTVKMDSAMEGGTE